MNDRFATYHPLVNFLYFSLVLGFSMALNHPLAQGISLFCAILYGVQTEGKKAVLFAFRWCLPILLLTAFMNPAFNHEGKTILLYFPTGNPLTLESILYGFSSGAMIVTVMLWFLSFNRVITSDKFIYLFGRIIPAMSLVLSMTLRFIPKFKAQMDQVIDAQKSIGRNISEGSLWHRTKIAVTVLSIMVTWALENAIETADSMKSRGYGCGNRTSFSIYQMKKKDWCLLGIVTALAMMIFVCAWQGGMEISYIPTVEMALIRQPWTMLGVFCYGALLSIPTVLYIMEEMTWYILKSKI